MRLHSRNFAQDSALLSSPQHFEVSRIQVANKRFLGCPDHVSSLGGVSITARKSSFQSIRRARFGREQNMATFVANPFCLQLHRPSHVQLRTSLATKTNFASPRSFSDAIQVTPSKSPRRRPRISSQSVPVLLKPRNASVLPIRPGLGCFKCNYSQGGGNGNKGNDGNDDSNGGGSDPDPGLRFAAAVFARHRVPELPEWRGNRGGLQIQLERFFSKIRISHLLLALNVAVFAIQVLYGPALMARGAKVNSAIAAGEYYRLFSPMFLHASTTHLMINSFSLNSTGPSVESWFGKKRFVALYLISGVCGNILSYICSPTPAVGASGAIFGLVGATAVILARHRQLLGRRAQKGLQSLAYIVLMNFGMGLAPGSRIDNFGHLGGFLGGIAYSYLCGPRMVARRGRSGRLLLTDVPVIADAIRDMRIRLRQMRKLINGR